MNTIWYFFAMVVAGLPPLDVTAGKDPRVVARPTATAAGPLGIAVPPALTPAWDKIVAGPWEPKPPGIGVAVGGAPWDARVGARETISTVWAGVAVRTLELKKVFVELSSLVLPVACDADCRGAAAAGLAPPGGCTALEPTAMAACTPATEGEGVAAGTGLSPFAPTEVEPPEPDPDPPAGGTGLFATAFETSARGAAAAAGAMLGAADEDAEPAGADPDMALSALLFFRNKCRKLEGFLGLRPSPL